MPLLFFLLALVWQDPPKQVVVISHRGEHLRHPENTLPAFRAAIEAGADYFELDVRTTSDGKFVLMHDATVDRMTNGHGAVAKMTFDEIRKLDAGAKWADFTGTQVPTFDEAFDVAKGKIKIYLDCKNIAAKDLVDAVERHGMVDQVVVYGGLGLHREVKKLNRKIRIMPEAVNAATAANIVEELAPKVMAFDANDFRDDVIAVARNADAEIYVDRLGMFDNPQAWEDAVRRGASGIQTDHPAELVKFLREHGWHK